MDSTTWVDLDQTLQDRLADTGTTYVFQDDEVTEADGPLAFRVDFQVGEAIERGRALGAGAMGEVWLASQGSLGREVALKTVKDGPHADAAARLLVREARIAAGLEHPNIVPIHMLGEDDQGRPALVMKRVEGVPLDLLVTLTADRRPPLDGADPLEQHLRLLLVVCNALGYAHSRGVLHRDLKPENVMVGSHGEVYVLDWGLAVTLDEVARGERRSWRAGTPLYMSPEAVRGEPPTVATDVYLLGGLLFFLLTGGAPRRGDSLPEVLASAEDPEPPDPGPGVWPGLAAICRRAMALDPALRHPDVEAFRAELASVLRDRAAHELAAKAWTRWRGVLQSDALDDEAFDRGLSEARFGFRAALDIQPDNADALDGLQLCLTRGIQRALDAGHWRAADLLLQELPREDPALAGRVAAARLESGALSARVDALQRELFEGRVDLALGARAGVSLVLAATFLGLPLVFWWGERTGAMPFDRQLFLNAHCIAWMVLGAMFWLLRRAIAPTRAMGRMILGVMTMIVSMWALYEAFVPFGLSDMETMTLNAAVVAVVCLALAAAVEVALLGPSLVFFVATFLTAARPEHGLLVLAAANLITPFTFLAVVLVRDRRD